MSELSEQIKQNNASAFTHSGKFHADDVFSAALLLYLNPEITITRGNKVPEDFEGIVFVVFPSNRGGYCIQPQKKEYSLNYKCCLHERMTIVSVIGSLLIFVVLIISQKKDIRRQMSLQKKSA